MIGKNSRLGMIGFLIVILFAGLAMVTKVQSQDQNPATTNTETDPQAAQAIPPILFSYQGRLLDKTGKPLNSSGLPMVFEIFPKLSGGSSCWKESHSSGNAVKVEDGVFQVTLGQISAISVACTTGDAYLQLTINGETLAPRERLTATATAVQASSLPDGAQLDGSMFVKGSIKAASGNPRIYLRNDNGNVLTSSTDSTHIFIDSDNNSNDQNFQVLANQSSSVSPAKTLFNVTESGHGTITGSFRIAGHNLYMENGQPGNVALRYDEGRRLHLLPWGGLNYRWDDVCIGCGGNVGLIVNGSTSVYGDLNLLGSCKKTATGTGDLAPPGEDCSGGNLTTAAIIEANLQTPDERSSERIERFSEGDVLCWEGEQLEQCAKENDRLVQAVATVDGRPIVIGAENIRVIGPVAMGDILVSSAIPGYAMVNNDPLPGSVIAQALDDLEGESGLIKAMIRKW